jgi:hypothetical protein
MVIVTRLRVSHKPLPPPPGPTLTNCSSANWRPQNKLQHMTPISSVSQAVEGERHFAFGAIEDAHNGWVVPHMFVAP